MIEENSHLPPKLPWLPGKKTAIFKPKDRQYLVQKAITGACTIVIWSKQKKPEMLASGQPLMEKKTFGGSERKKSLENKNSQIRLAPL